MVHLVQTIVEVINMEWFVRAKALQTDSDVKIRTLANEFDISEHTLSNYLNGKRTMPYGVLVQFANYFGVTTDYLLGRAEQPELPFAVSLNERAMLSEFRTLGKEQKELIVQNIKLMKAQNER